MSKESIEQMSSHETDPSFDQKWPSVPFAYDFVMPSYQFMVTRFEAIDSRIQGIQTFAATLTLGVPVVGQFIRKDISYTSAWFMAVLIVFAAIVGLSVIARTRGHLEIPSPQLIHDRSLHLSEWDFKRYALYWAADAFEKNRTLINQKGYVGNWLSALTLIEALLAVCWIAFSC